MPRYDYSCQKCSTSKEVVKSFDMADSEEVCESCGEVMIKVYGSFGIQFKGSGFYKTDNPK